MFKTLTPTKHKSTKKPIPAFSPKHQTPTTPQTSPRWVLTRAEDLIPPNLSQQSTSTPVPPTNPFTFPQTNLANVTSQPIQWLWQQRLPLTGLTLLDGDHGCGK